MVAVHKKLPSDFKRDVVRVARPTTRNDRDVVEAIGATRLFSSADLYFHDGILGLAADRR